MSQLSGMTGFARADGQCGNWAWSWEVRSVNGKGLDARCRVPTGFDRLEGRVRDCIKAYFHRGNLQCSLQLRREAGEAAITLNTELIDRLLEAQHAYVQAGQVDVARFDGLLAVPGVIERRDAERDPEEDEALDAAVLKGLEHALEDLRQTRLEEGRQLHDILAGHVDTLAALSADARRCDAVRLEAIRDRIAGKFTELLPEGLDADRLATEAAALAVRMDVREELERLDAHVEAARALLAGGSPAGRKLDFLSQEFNREANTLCSKSSDSSLTRIGLAIKNTVDQFREQVQNVE
ncbi:YicC/YloC family endoribonuclease [Maricaulis sp. CAU 1757]